MKQLKKLFLEDLQRWDKAHRIIGRIPPSQLWDESCEAFASLPSEIVSRGTIVDIGAGSGILGFPWILGSTGRRAVFIEPDTKKAAFILQFLSGSGRELSKMAKVINSRFEDVSRETVVSFDPDYFLAARAFSGSRSLEEAQRHSNFKNESIFVFESTPKGKKFEVL